MTKHFKKISLISGAVLLLPLLALLTTHYSLLTTLSAAAQTTTFTGPGTCAAGQCQGALGVNSTNNIGVGAGATSTARFYVYSTTSNVYAIQASGTIYSATGGFKFPDGTIQTTGAGATTIPAANVSAGAFGSNTGGGNYSFPAALTVTGTTTLATSFGNVGIGTTAPSKTLSVNGDASLNNLYVQSVNANIFHPGTGALGLTSGDSASVRGYLLFGTSAGADWDARMTHVGLGIGNAVNPLNTLDVNGNAVIGSSYAGVNFAPVNGLLVQGNVGIGTTTPARTLSVQGTVGWYAPNNNNLGALSYSGTDSGNLNLFSGGVSTAFIGTNQSSYFNGGNVGIGTASPNTPLKVIGTNNVESPAIPKVFAVGDTSAPGKTISLGYNVTADAGVLAAVDAGVGWKNISINPNGGNVGIGTTGPAAFLHIKGQNINNRGQLSLEATDYSQITFYEGPITTTNLGAQIYWDATNNDFVLQNYNGGSFGDLALNPSGGNVGIATTTPGYPLTVAGTIYSSTGGFRFPDGTTQTTAFSGSSTQVVSATNVSSGSFGANTGGGNYSFPASVGIGTTNPGQALTVTGSAPFLQIDATGPNGGQLYFTRSGVAKGYMGSVGVAGGLITGSAIGDLGIRSENGNILLSTDAGASAQVYLKNGGNVGIGTTNPLVKLTVSNAGAAGIEISPAGGANGPYIQSYNRSTSAYTSIDFYGSVYTFNTGNVGIGTTAPAAKLQVSGGDISLGGDTTGIGNYGNSYTNIFTGAIAGQAGSIRFFSGVTGSGLSGGTERVRIDSTGNVGIGTTAPSQKLEIIGNASSSGGIYTGDWFYNRVASTGLYNQVNGIHWYNEGTYWTTSGNAILFRNGYGSTVNGYVYTDRTNFGMLNGSGGWAFYIANATAGGTGIVTAGSIYVAATSTLVGTVTVGATGTGKINVGTVDPIYTIGGKQYATYLPGMTGQKEETTGNIQLDCTLSSSGLTRGSMDSRLRGNDKECKQVIDFNNLEKGSDLWLFAQATNLAKQFDQLIVMLTPSFDGRVWYTKDSATNKLTIHASLPTTHYPLPTNLQVSYRLTAPRFDSAEWTNYAKDGEGIGFNLDKLPQ